MKSGTVQFSENNSGGHWWLKQEDYEALLEHGWEPEYNDISISLRNHDGWKRPMNISKHFPSFDMGIAEWQTLTGEYAGELGCQCCGPPYELYFHGDDGSHDSVYHDYPDDDQW